MQTPTTHTQTAAEALDLSTSAPATIDFPVWKTVKGQCYIGELDLILTSPEELGVEREWGPSAKKYFQSCSIARRAVELGLKLPSMHIARHLCTLDGEKGLFALIMNEYGEVCAVEPEKPEGKRLCDLFHHMGFHDNEKFKFVFVKPRKVERQ